MSDNEFSLGDLPIISPIEIPNYHSTILDKVIIASAVAGSLTFAQPSYNFFTASNEKEDVEQVYNIAGCLNKLKNQYKNFDIGSIEKGQNRKDKLIQSLLAQVFSFKTLENNWDGYGAIPVSALSANSASTIIRHLSEVSLSQVKDIFPNSNGTVSIKWSNAFGEKVSLCIGANMMSYYVAKLQNEINFFDDIETSPETICSLDDEIRSVVAVNA